MNGLRLASARVCVSLDQSVLACSAVAGEWWGVGDGASAGDEGFAVDVRSAQPHPRWVVRGDGDGTEPSKGRVDDKCEIGFGLQ